MSKPIKISINGDIHIPYINPIAYDLWKTFMRSFKPNKIILNGDIIDFWQISKFLKDPSRKNTIKQDIEMLKNLLKDIRDTFPKAQLIYLFGNHEDRLRKIYWEKLPELSDIGRLEDVLELEKLKITYYLQDNDYHIEAEGKLLITHGTVISQDSGMTARRMLKKYGLSVISNHTHRLGSTYVNDCLGTRVAFENGCMCNLDLAKEWRVSYPPNWQVGFSTVMVFGNRFYVQQVPIIKEKLVYGEEIYENSQ